MTNNDHQSKNPLSKHLISFPDIAGIGVSIGAIFPILVAAIVMFYWLVRTTWEYRDEWEFTLLLHLGYLAVLLAPFLFSAIVIWFFTKKHKIILGLVVGIVIVVAPYLLWSLNYYYSVIECAKTEPMCGEWAPLTIAFALLMCLGNFFAFMGFAFLLTIIKKIQKSQVQQTQ